MNQGNPVIKKVRQELRSNADEKVRIGGETYFKEPVKLYGVKTPAVTKIAKEHFKEIKNLAKAEILSLCEELWKSGYMEESFVAHNWSYALRKQYEPGDFKIFERWVKTYVSNWASCDGFCNHSVGTFVEMYPDHVKYLKSWAKSSNRWVKRAAAVTLIIPAKRGKFLSDVFDIADILLLDRDDMVQKGYGWMLKVASQPHEKEVFEYVLARRDVMPRTALRYAIEKMPQELRKKAIQK